MSKFTCADKSVIDGLPLGPIRHEINGFVFRWPHVGTSPKTFTSSEAWHHNFSECPNSDKWLKFSDFMLGCSECGAISHSMVNIEILLDMSNLKIAPKFPPLNI